METTTITAIAPETLYQNNLKLAEFFVKKYFPSIKPGSFLHEELTGEARIALWRAAISYNPERSKFTTYAGILIHGYIIKYYSRKYKKQAALFEFSLDFTPNDFNSTVGEMIEDDFDTESLALKNIAEKAANSIVKEKYPYLDLYFLQGLTQSEISRMIGKSQNTVSKIIKIELIKIRRELKMA